MPTDWFYPNSVSQHAEVEQHIAWTDNGTSFSQIKKLDGTFLTTVKDLLHISNYTVNDIKMKTHYLYLKDFRIVPPAAVAGIEVEVKVNRGGRITDDTVQLMYADQFIGDNQADFKLDVQKLYGRSTDLWGITDTVILSDPEFGIGVRFQSHPSWPHRESPKLDKRERIWQQQNT
jgi:hypothetical protein